MCVCVVVWLWGVVGVGVGACGGGGGGISCKTVLSIDLAVVAAAGLNGGFLIFLEIVCNLGA